MNQRSKRVKNRTDQREPCQVIKQSNGKVLSTKNVKIDSSQLPPAYQKLVNKILGGD